MEVLTLQSAFNGQVWKHYFDGASRTSLNGNLVAIVGLCWFPPWNMCFLAHSYCWNHAVTMWHSTMLSSSAWWSHTSLAHATSKPAMTRCSSSTKYMVNSKSDLQGISRKPGWSAHHMVLATTGPYHKFWDLLTWSKQAYALQMPNSKINRWSLWNRQILSGFFQEVDWFEAAPKLIVNPN